LCAGAVDMSTKIGGRWFRVCIPLYRMKERCVYEVFECV
jgi:hypothetical protein